MMNKSYKRGTAFAVSIAGANRDPEANNNPNEFNIFREDIKHISFGYGPHMCIGASLARIESRIAFEVLFERFLVIFIFWTKIPNGEEI